MSTADLETRDMRCQIMFPYVGDRGKLRRLLCCGARLCCGALLGIWIACATAPASCEPWISDQGDGTYKNPVLFADYSDPDVIRVGDDFYMTVSSFNCVPALPILHSRDLVNWELIGHAVERLPKEYDTVQPGNGIWAPSLRFHNGYFWIFVGDPDLGILMTRAKSPAGPWQPLHNMLPGRGLIDPCPLWDGDKAYLVHALAKSRAGRNDLIVGYEMAPDGRGVIGEEQLVIDGRDGVHPTIEGPKIYRRNGWYYIFAPAGGVKPGWQLAARSRSPLGPYETRRVLEQGSTDINGPHQGGWVELENHENWFVHFQDRGAYGRVVHLNPVRWKDDWPEMGVDRDGNGVGEPVSAHKKPTVDANAPTQSPTTSDAFSGPLGLQWQWQANPRSDWATLEARQGWLRLRAVEQPPGDLAATPNALLQKFPAPEFTATTRLDFTPGGDGTRAGLMVMGLTYAGILVHEADGKFTLEQLVNTIPGPEGEDELEGTASVAAGPLWLRVSVKEGARCTFSYSTDGNDFKTLGKPFVAGPGRWIGAKVGLVCTGEDGHADFDWFTID